jgi:hypothetical protein
MRRRDDPFGGVEPRLVVRPQCSDRRLRQVALRLKSRDLLG